jgi:hypothetical protein
MRKLSPPYVFIIGSIVLLVATSLYYFFIPRFEYFGEGYSIYRPNNSLPDPLPEKYAVSNVYLIFRYGEYLIMYLAAFVLVYFICSKIKQLDISRRFVWMHLILTSVAFILLIYINPYIILNQNISGYLSDVYIGADVSNNEMIEGNKLILWYSSLQTPTSMIGILLCVIGVGVFAIGTFRGMEFRRIY